jgi:hypothetical protein
MTRAGDDAAHAALRRCASERADADGFAVSESERVQWPVAEERTPTHTRTRPTALSFALRGGLNVWQYA